MKEWQRQGASCLCRKLKNSITSEREYFFQCHCMSCRKATAFEFVANIIAVPAEIKCASGEDNIK
jgi:hypothetical protein